MAIILINELGGVFTALILSLSIWHLGQLKLVKTPPSNTLLNIVAIIGMLILSFSIGFSDSISLFVSLIVLACQLKAIQAKNNAQYQYLAILNFFTIPCLFLFSQSLYTSVIVLVFLALNLGFMIAVAHKQPLQLATKDAFIKLLLVLPISALLVIFFPKLPAFWQLPGPTLAKTGLSEEVNPFSIAQLSQSDELAFRAILEQENDLKSPYYWRAIIHDTYDGKSWKMSTRQNISSATSFSNQGSSYQILAEPSNYPWLFSLGYSTSDTQGVTSNMFGTLFRTISVNGSFEYKAVTIDNTIRSESISNWQYRHFTRFPVNLNPRAQALALEWDRESNTTAQFINLMKRYFIQNNFQYTLNPQPMLSESSVDEFIFENKSGFCGHYASSVAMMMRSVGIPTRLVSGYLGGEYNRKNNYFSIYQYDAHAWVEYFTPTQGWQLLDPTAWVSPERLLGSLSQHSSLANEFKSNLGLSLIALSSVPGIDWLRLKLEEYDYQWTRWVLNFNEDKQRSFLHQLFGKYARSLSGALSIFGLVTFFSVFFWFIQRQKVQKVPIEVELYNKLQLASNLALKNVTPLQFVTQLKEKHPELSNELDQFYRDFAQSRYQGKILKKRQRVSVLKLIKSVKTKTKRSL